MVPPLVLTPRRIESETRSRAPSYAAARSRDAPLQRPPVADTPNRNRLADETRRNFRHVIARAIDTLTNPAER
jgi:hypothetical protein